MRTSAGILLVFLVLLVTLPSQAQDQAQLRLESVTTTLQTGQEYDITLYLENAPGTWVITAEVDFDPRLLYVLGTQAGSPVRHGDLFAPLDSTVVVRNAVERNKVVYTISMLAPAEPVTGSGVVGTFRIFPLSAGPAQLRFSRANLTGIARAADGTVQSVPQTVLPVLLDLTITGDTVEPPSEATATPEPTETPTPQPTFAGNPQTAQPTLVNVTAAPRSDTPVPATEVPVETTESSDSSILMIVAVILIVIGGAGLLALFLSWRRAQRRR